MGENIRIERQPFLVTGLPRSATAWLSVVCDCPHEPTGGEPELAIGLWQSGAVGISDSGLSLHLQQIMDAVAPRVLMVRRPRSDVLASFRAYLNGCLRVDWAEIDDRLRRADEAMDAMTGHPNVRSLNFSQLRDERAVASALHWLTGAAPERLGRLMSLNVQSDLGFNLSRLQARAA